MDDKWLVEFVDRGPIQQLYHQSIQKPAVQEEPRCCAELSE